MDPILKKVFIVLVKLARREYEAGREISLRAKALILYLNDLAEQEAEKATPHKRRNGRQASGEPQGGDFSGWGILPGPGEKLPTLH